MPTSKRKSDPKAGADRPLTAVDLKRMKRTPQVKIVRRALELTQEEFSERYRIPLGTLRDWEQGRSAPDQPARAYLRVIAAEPETTAQVHGIHQRARRSASIRTTATPWTQAEVKQLGQLARENTPTRVIGLKLGRTEGAVHKKASEDGISLKSTNQSPYNRRK
jgi:putative transcriptional regulator